MRTSISDACARCLADDRCSVRRRPLFPTGAPAATSRPAAALNRLPPIRLQPGIDQSDALVPYRGVHAFLRRYAFTRRPPARYWARRQTSARRGRGWRASWQHWRIFQTAPCLSAAPRECTALTTSCRPNATLRCPLCTASLMDRIPSWFTAIVACNQHGHLASGTNMESCTLASRAIRSCRRRCGVEPRRFNVRFPWAQKAVCWSDSNRRRLEVGRQPDLQHIHLPPAGESLRVGLHSVISIGSKRPRRWMV